MADNVVIYKGQRFDERYFVSGAIQTQAAPAGDTLFPPIRCTFKVRKGTPPLGYNFYTSDEMFLTADRVSVA